MGSLESDTTEQLPFHFSLSCIGEGHGNPLQCSCLENPRDRGAWWAAVYGVTQSSTRLKRLSSSSSSNPEFVPYVCESASVFLNIVHLYHFFLDSTYKGCHRTFLLLCPTYFISMTVSRCLMDFNESLMVLDFHQMTSSLV